jgi:deazaflavin-dependent oxidoreductase (nitroreductase family)
MDAQTDNNKETKAMAQPFRRPASRARQARIMRVVNVPMRFLLGLPFATPLSRQLMLLSFTGRKTGKAYRQPVSYVPDGDTLLTPGGGRWKLNLREDQPIRIRLRGRDVLARPEFIEDVDEVERLLRRMAAVNPRVMAFVPVRGPDGGIDRGKLETALSYGFRIIRWHIDGPRARQAG